MPENIEEEHPLDVDEIVIYAYNGDVYSARGTESGVEREVLSDGE